jgi:hypothetical protein
MTTEGFTVVGHDNDSFAFHSSPDESRRARVPRIQQSVLPDMSGLPYPGHKRCPKCGELLDKWNEPLHGFVVKKRRLDLSSTYDGVAVASEKFRVTYVKHKLTGLKFIALPDDPAFFQVQAKAIVKFDFKSGGTEFENQCPKCKRFESVTGADPVRLLRGGTIPGRGFVRTDLEFGGGDEKSPRLLCGIKAGQVLKAAKLRGLCLRRIE